MVAVEHVPAPPKRVTNRGGPIRGANEHQQWARAWETSARHDDDSAKSLLADAAAMRERNAKASELSRAQALQQHKIVFDNLQRRVRLLKAVRQKISAADAKLQRANAALEAAHLQALELTEKLERPMAKCAVRVQLRGKRPAEERVADEVTRTVQQHADGVATFIHRLQQLTNSAAALINGNARHSATLQADVANKTASIRLEEDCIALNAAPVFTSLGGAGGGFTPRAPSTPNAVPPPPPGQSSEGLPAAAKPTPATIDGPSSSSSNPFQWTFGSLADSELLQCNAGGRTASGAASEWKQRTALLLERVQQLYDRTVELTTKLTAVMAQSREQQRALGGEVSLALGKKHHATTKQSERLAANIASIDTELALLVGQRAALADDIALRQQPLFVAKQRLDARRARPNAENVRDEVEQELEKEFLMLAKGIEALQNRQKQVDLEAQRIRQVHARLRRTLSDKHASLALERECIDLDGRSSYNLTSRGSSRASSRRSRSLASSSSSSRCSERNARPTGSASGRLPLL
jgi:hypothetical protein